MHKKWFLLFCWCLLRLCRAFLPLWHRILALEKRNGQNKDFLQQFLLDAVWEFCIFCAGFFGGNNYLCLLPVTRKLLLRVQLFERIFCRLYSYVYFIQQHWIFQWFGKHFPVMLQGITSAFCIRIPVSIFIAGLPNTSLVYMGMATPITTVYGIIFFAVCFVILKKKNRKKMSL